MTAGVKTTTSSEPTFRSVWPGDDSVALEVLEFAEAIDLRLDPWQAQVLSDWTLVDPVTGRWTHRSAALIVPRQSGKTYSVSARLLFALFFGSEKNCMYSAHRFQSATAQFRELVSIIQNNDELSKRVKRMTSSTGNEVIETKRGGALFVQSRTNTMTSQTRGRNFDLVILDEALVLAQTYMSALLPTLSSRPNPQLIYASSGGDHDSEVLAKVRQAGYDRAPGLTLSEWAAAPEDDPSDPATWAKANPSFPIRPTREAVQQEYRELTPSAFARERLGIWSTGAPEPAILWESWEKCEVADAGFPGGGVTLAVDVSTDGAGTRTAALVAGWKADDGVVSAVLVQQGQDTGWLPARVQEIATRYGAYEVRMSVGGAQDVADAISSAGVFVDRVQFLGLKAASQRLVEMLGGGRVRVQASEVLGNAARTVAKQRGANNEWNFSTRGTPPAGLNALALAVAGADTSAGVDAAIW